MVLLIGVLICGYKASDKPHFFQFANSQTEDEDMGSRMGESAEKFALDLGQSTSISQDCLELITFPFHTMPTTRLLRSNKNKV
jgi:hypothetical protein